MVLRPTSAALMRPTGVLQHWLKDNVNGFAPKVFRTGPRFVPYAVKDFKRRSGELYRPYNNMWGHPKFHRGGEMWRIVDARGQEIEALAEKVVNFVIGRHRPDWRRDLLMGDQVIIINCRHVTMDDEEGTPLPWRLRPYTYVTGYPKQWGVQIRRAEEEYLIDPARPMHMAIQERLPSRHPLYKGRSQASINKRFWIEKVHCFADDEHPFKEMEPVPLVFPIETVGTEQWHGSAESASYVPRRQAPPGWRQSRPPSRVPKLSVAKVPPIYSSK